MKRKEVHPFCFEAFLVLEILPPDTFGGPERLDRKTRQMEFLYRNNRSVENSLCNFRTVTFFCDILHF